MCCALGSKTQKNRIFLWMDVNVLRTVAEQVFFCTKYVFIKCTCFSQVHLHNIVRIQWLGNYGVERYFFPWSAINQTVKKMWFLVIVIFRFLTSNTRNDFVDYLVQHFIMFILTGLWKQNPSKNLYDSDF